MSMVSGRSFNEWLEEFRQRITETVNTERLDGQLIDRIYEVEHPPNYIWRFQKEHKENYFVLSSRTESVTPAPINISAPLEEWITSPNSFAINHYLEEIGRLVVFQEARVAIMNLMDEAHEITSTETRLTKLDIQNASAWVRTNGHYADALIIHPCQFVDLSRNEEIMEAWEIDRHFVERQGRDFCGMVNGLKAYRTAAIDKRFSLVYDKSRSYLKRTPLKIRYDNSVKPQQLIVEEHRVAWFSQEGSAARVHFSPP